MKQPYKITIEQYEYKYTIEVDHSDITYTEYIDLLKQISLAASWPICFVIELFDSGKADEYSFKHGATLGG